jgi:hypothetical protein
MQGVESLAHQRTLRCKRGREEKELRESHPGWAPLRDFSSHNTQGLFEELESSGSAPEHIKTVYGGYWIPAWIWLVLCQQKYNTTKLEHTRARKLLEFLSANEQQRKALEAVALTDVSAALDMARWLIEKG